MDVNPNLSEKARRDYQLVLRATRENDQKAYAQLMSLYRDSIFHPSTAWCLTRTMRTI